MEAARRRFEVLLFSSHFVRNRAKFAQLIWSESTGVRPAQFPFESTFLLRASAGFDEYPEHLATNPQLDR